jgi:hypothetical protein
VTRVGRLRSARTNTIPRVELRNVGRALRTKHVIRDASQPLYLVNANDRLFILDLNAQVRANVRLGDYLQFGPTQYWALSLCVRAFQVNRSRCRTCTLPLQFELHNVVSHSITKTVFAWSTSAVRVWRSHALSQQFGPRTAGHALLLGSTYPATQC